MNFPESAVSEGSGLTLGALVDLMRIASANPQMDKVAVQITPEAHAYFKTNPEKFDPFTGRRVMRVNELCKEALPYMTKIYEIQEERDKAKNEAATMRRQRDEANERAKELNRTLFRLHPELYEPDWDEETDSP